MNRTSWFIVVGVCCAVLAFVVAITVVVYRHFQIPRPLGGPMVVYSNGDVPTHGFLGMDFQDPTAVPLVIRNVVDGSGAAESGLQVSDTIISSGAVQQPSLAELQQLCQSRVPGDKLSLTVRRDSREIELIVRLIGFKEMVLLRQQERRYNADP